MSDKRSGRGGQRNAQADLLEDFYGEKSFEWASNDKESERAQEEERREHEKTCSQGHVPHEIREN